MLTPSTPISYEHALEVERSHFDRLAQRRGDIWWGSCTVSGRRRLMRRADWMAEILGPFREARVLEVGCGTGALTLPLLERLPGLRLRACDISSRALEVASRRCAAFANASFEMADLVHAPFPAAEFDVVIGNSVLHHMPLRESLNAIHRALRPGGRIIFFEPNMLNPQVALERHVRWIGRLLDTTPGETAFIRHRLRKDLVEAGFREVHIEPFDFLHPAIPGAFAPLAEVVGRCIERIPLVREIAGSLVIQATRSSA